MTKTHFKSYPIALSEDSSSAVGTRKLQILRTGDFTNEKYGAFKITKPMLSEMVDNFKTGIRGVVPALDYSHESEGVAAGWFKELFTEKDGQELWANIEMTPKGEKVLSDREFAYTSAEFDTNYSTNENPVRKVGAVLLGAGLTNRPVIKNMQSVIQLSEGETMDIKELEEKLVGVEGKLSEKEEFEKKLMEGLGVESLEQVMEMITAMKGEKEKLAETETEVKEVKEKLELSEKKLVEVSTELLNSKKESEFNIMLSEGKVCVAQKESFIKNDMVEFVKNAQAMNLSENGHGNTTEIEVKDPTAKITTLAEEMIKENSRMSFTEAVSKVRKENPELVKKLQEKK